MTSQSSTALAKLIHMWVVHPHRTGSEQQVILPIFLDELDLLRPDQFLHLFQLVDIPKVLAVFVAEGVEQQR